MNLQCVNEMTCNDTSGSIVVNLKTVYDDDDDDDYALNWWIKAKLIELSEHWTNLTWELCNLSLIAKKKNGIKSLTYPYIHTS